MTLTLNLTPEQEGKLQAEAARTGLPLDEFALRRLLDKSPQSARSKVARQQAVLRRSALGKYADVPTSSEAFAAHKQEEKERENRFIGTAR